LPDPFTYEPAAPARVLPLRTTRSIPGNHPRCSRTLALLYQSLSWIGDAELCNSVEYSTVSTYRKKVLDKLHKDRPIEFDKKNKRAKISPKGSAHVEIEILKTRV